MPQVQDIIEAWFFRTEDEAREDNLENAYGYAKTVNGECVIKRGITSLRWTFTRSSHTQTEA